MKRAIFFKISVLCNVVFMIVMLFFGYKFKAKIYNKLNTFKHSEIVMFGNSLTYNGDWCSLLDRSDVLNSGTSGFTTSHFVIILDSKVIHNKPSICFIEGGINDIFVGIPLLRTFRNYESIVDSLIAHDVEPVLQSTFYVNLKNDSLTTVYNSMVDSLNSYLINLADKKGITYLDINKSVSQDCKLKDQLTEDGIHVNRLGYEIWAKYVKNELIERKIQ